MKLIFGDKLGRGAFAHVWGAEDTLGRPVAVKFFSDSTPSQVEQQALAHAKALVRVRHPAVVAVLAVEEQPHPETGVEHMAIVMERVPGASLALSTEEIDGARAERILLDLSAGLQAIHDAELVHGDLHDANVMVHAGGATLLDILYTHTLAEVGTRTAQRSREQDLRDMARVCRQVCERAGFDRNAVTEAHYAADSESSAALVAAPFLAIVHAPTPVTSLPAATVGSDATALLMRVQAQKELLSALLPSIHGIAVRAGNNRLAALCESELTGCKAPSEEATQREPDEDIAHRVITFYIGQGVAINPGFFSTGQAAMEYIRRHPDQFVASRILHPTPLPTIERQIAERPAKSLVVLQNPSEPAPGYADGDTFHRIVEGLRARLSAHLLRISKTVGEG